jgi:hypothetical protein
MGVIYKNLGFLGFPLYEVGNDGSVMSLKWGKTNTKHLLTPSKLKNGYLYVYLTNKKDFTFIGLLHLHLYQTRNVCLS